MGSLAATGQVDVTGTTTLTGAAQVTGELTVGKDEGGHDVKLFGDTQNSFLQWDQGSDLLRVAGSLVMTGTATVQGDSQLTGNVVVGVRRSALRCTTSLRCAAMPPCGAESFHRMSSEDREQ